VRLRSKGSAEYCLCQLPSGCLPVPRHKDALPDDGRQEGSSTPSASSHAAAVGGSSPPASHTAAAGLCGSSSPQILQSPSSPQILQSPSAPQQQSQQDGMQQQGCASAAAVAAAGALGPSARRVSMFVFLNSDWDKDGGGVVRLWPPMRPTGPPSTTAASAARRSPTSSDAGTTFSEISDCGSLRWVGRLFCCSRHCHVIPVSEGTIDDLLRTSMNIFFWGGVLQVATLPLNGTLHSR
jgi:hypothetical protein